VVWLAFEADAITHAERLGHVPRQLKPASPVEHRVLDGVPEAA
jgi:hypothetical protein